MQPPVSTDPASKTPQRVVVSQDSTAAGAPPPSLIVTSTGSASSAASIPLEAVGEASQGRAVASHSSSNKAPHGVGAPLPPPPGRAVATTPLQPTQATPSTKTPYSDMKPSAATSAMEAAAVTPGPAVAITRVLTPPQASSTPGGSVDPSPDPPPRQVVSSELLSRDGVVLGVQVLERQQAELERQQAELERQRRIQATTPARTVPTPTPHPTPATDQRQAPPQVAQTPSREENLFDDDENTEPSSMTGSAAGTTGDQVGLEVLSHSRENSMVRFLRSTRDRISSSGDRANYPDPIGDHRAVYGDEEDDEWEGEGERPLIYGYLQKLGRNGKWQRRFFETDGEYLSYYKSRKRQKLLATLDLCKVGEISIDSQDPTGCTFTIQVADRPYSLMAETSGTCKDWVITLNRVKEARMHLGGVQLVKRKFQPPTLLERGRHESDDDYAKRVVVAANRQRTHAVNEFEKLVGSEGTGPPDFWAGSPTYASSTGTISTASPKRSPKRIIAHLPPQVLARWQKRRSVVYGAGKRIVRWMRRMRELRCLAHEDTVVLDHHVHPPGHDVPSLRPARKAAEVPDRSKLSAGSADSTSSSPPGIHRNVEAMSHSDWIGKEAELSARSRDATDNVVQATERKIRADSDTPRELS